VVNRRRFFRAAVCAILAAPPLARAQTRTNVRRIGILYPGAPDSAEELQGERGQRSKLGWIEGQNLLVERRYANHNPDSLRPLAEELVRLKVEVIVTAGTAATLAAMSATNTIPIVFASAGDPAGAGLVASLARPGGNVTGFSIVGTEMTAKRLAVLRELLPAVPRVGILETSNPYYRAARKAREQACRSLSIQPIFVEVATSSDVAKAVAEVARRGGQGLLVDPEALFQDNLIELMRAVLRHALPMATSRAFIQEVGALVSYDNVKSEEDDRGAAFVDRILRGARPADLPVEQPTKFELIINLKTAKTLGIFVPPSLLSRAHEFIE
jgi:putative ABC transport system substrate-binding protein